MELAKRSQTDMPPQDPAERRSATMAPPRGSMRSATALDYPLNLFQPARVGIGPQD